MDKNRRTALKSLMIGSIAVTTSGLTGLFAKNIKEEEMEKINHLKGNINHSVSWWIYQKYGLDVVCKKVKEMGLKGIDLVGPKEWPTLKKYGLDSPICNGAELGLYDGFNDKKFHEKLIAQYSEMIPLVSKAGYKNLICFSGARRGISDEEGWNNCLEGLQKLMPLAEKYRVVLVMELLNSKKDHHDYQCDRTWWGAELCKKLSSDHFKLLYDIYHMQIMEGDLIQNIRDYHPYIAHYHTGGVPGRHEIDNTQEIYYPAVMKAIVETGYKGFVGQEFVPKATDMFSSLEQCIRICDV